MDDDPVNKSRQPTFARTLKAVDVPTNPGPDLQFPNFSSLPPEIRLAIWELILPDSQEELPALFSQRHSYTWTDSDGYLEEPDGHVPICMTTTCAALLHVNRESRYVVLAWADSHDYELCFRGFCRKFDDCGTDSDSDSDSEHSEKWLPVHGPIFVRRWDPSKDILNVFPTVDDYGIPSEWNENYVNGEKLHNVQHIAFGMHDTSELVQSRWFYQLLAAMPDLKSVSFNYSYLMEADGETFHVRYIEARSVGNPWGTRDDNAGSAHGGEDGSSRSGGSRLAYVRWEAAFGNAESVKDFHGSGLKEQFVRGYLDPDNWPPIKGEDSASSSSGDDGASEPGENETGGVLEKLPPWIWDRVKGDIAFEVRNFVMVERRGYDDVRGGLVAECIDLYDF